MTSLQSSPSRSPLDGVIPSSYLYPLRDIAAGTVGGILGKLIEYPFDTVKVRLQALQIKGIETPSPSVLFSQIYEREGFRALFKGMSLPLAGTVLETATLFLTNGYLKRSLSEIGHIQPGENLPMPYVLLAGAGTGFVVSFVLTPIELVKCRLQVASDTANTSNPAVPYRGAVDCISRSIREEGLSVLYRGHTGTVLREVPGTACWFGAYELFLRAMTPQGVSREELPSWIIVIAGALGGVSYWSVMYPADTVKSVMQTTAQDSSSSKGGPSNTSTFMKTFLQLYRSVGIRGLYVGLTPTCVRAAPSNAVIFLGYEFSSRIIGSWMGLEEPKPPSPPPPPPQSSKPKLM